MELTTASCLCHSQLPLAAQTLGTQLLGASVCLPWARVTLPGLLFPTRPTILYTQEGSASPPPAGRAEQCGRRSQII